MTALPNFSDDKIQLTPRIDMSIEDRLKYITFHVTRLTLEMVLEPIHTHQEIIGTFSTQPR
jgi:hypothetical protein